MAKERITGHTFNVFSSLFDTGMNKKMDRSKLQIYLYLCYRANYKSGRSWPKIERICTDCDVSKPTAHAAIKWLSEEGLIEVTRVYHHNSPHNYYTVLGCAEELPPMELEADEPYEEDETVLPVRDPRLNALNLANETTVKPTLPCKVKPIIPSPEPYTMEPSPDKDTFIESNYNTGKKSLKKTPNPSEPSALFDNTEAPTKEDLSASARRKRDDELKAIYHRIHEIAEVDKPIMFKKSDKDALIEALGNGVTADRLGIAWQKALETSELKYWPFHCVIEKLHLLETKQKPKPTTAKRRTSEETMEHNRQVMSQPFDPTAVGIEILFGKQASAEPSVDMSGMTKKVEL